MQSKIPTTIITGFLGAGKTTLIRHMLGHARGKRIALIINEFGELGIDRGVLSGCGDLACRDEDMVELANGCICCTVADEFLPTMNQLIERDDRPDHIVIETSGLALPQPLVRAFQWPAIRNAVTVDGVVTIVDGPAFAAGRFAHDEASVLEQRSLDETIEHATPLVELFEDQLVCADMVLVSKADLLEDGAWCQMKSDLAKRVRPGTKIVAAAHGEIDPEILLGLTAQAEIDSDSRKELHHGHAHDDHDHHHEHGHDEFDSFVLDLPPVHSVEALRDKVKAIAESHPVLRVKGFAAVIGKPMRLTVQGVGPRVDSYFDRPLADHERDRTRLVIIGMRNMDRASIASQMRN